MRPKVSKEKKLLYGRENDIGSMSFKLPFRKCNFPMNPHILLVRWSSLGRSVS